MKLKTLKDLEKRQSINSFICINPIELKAEAVKWVFQWTKASIQYYHLHRKVLKSLVVNLSRDGKIHRIILTKEVIDYIKFYNNITEEAEND